MADEITLTGHQALDALMHRAGRSCPADLPDLASQAAAQMDLHELTIYLADVQQDVLIPLATRHDPEQPTLPIDTSLPGSSFRTLSVRVKEAETSGLYVWLPMMDGINRIGVMGLRTAQLDSSTLLFCRSLATTLTLIILTKGDHSDSLTRLQRTGLMQLPAEMVWAFLPPRTLMSPEVVSTAVLEPAYNVGGDAFDHSLVDHTLHASVLDAMGHDLRAGLATSVAMAGCRNTRRSGGGLKELADTVDEALNEVFPHLYCTGVFTHLDLDSGELSWINCGHPTPLIIRDQELLPSALERSAEAPLGLGKLAGEERQIHRYLLKPGDRVLLYTDGVTDSRSPTGERFGLDTFAEFIIRATAAGEPSYEVLRRLIHAILGHHEGKLTDDATILLFEWLPPSEASSPADQ